MASEFNPVFETCGIRMTLIEICHDAGNRARGGETYLGAYYRVLENLVPDHPALADYKNAA